LISAALTATCLLLLCQTSAHAQGGMPLWTNVFRGSDYPAALAIDSSGNFFVAGGSSSGDYVTIKCSNEGVPLWTNYYNGPANLNDHATAIVVDRIGNVFVSGTSEDIRGRDKYVLIKYSNAGVPLWTNRYEPEHQVYAIAVDSEGNVYNGPTNGAVVASAIAVDGSGNVFVTGSSSAANGYFDYATIKYSNSGVPLWTNRYNGPVNNQDVANAIAIDVNGNVFVTGYSTGNGTYLDYATLKYSNAGAPLWTNRYNGPTNQGDSAQAIAVGSNGNVFVTGSSDNGYFFVGNVFVTDLAYATIAYSNSGLPLWTNRYDGPPHNSDSATAIAVDSVGNVFVTGHSTVDSLPTPAIEDWATVAYSKTGEPLWENRYNSPDNLYSRANAIAVDQAGNVFVAGFAGHADGYYYTTIKYSSSVPPHVRLDFQKLNNELVLSWTNVGFNLQSAPTITSTFTNIPGATSPYTNSLAAPRQFFRLTGN
jgi:hypothetical protein